MQLSEPGRASAFERAVVRLNDALGILGAVILVAMLLMVALSVVMRYVFESPLVWSDQVAAYGLVYMTFIGAPRVLARRGHVAVDILETSLSAPNRKILRVFVDTVGMLYCLFFCYLAIAEVTRLVARHSAFMDAFTVPQWMVYIVILVGAALLFLQFLANLLADLRDLRDRRTVITSR